MREEEIETRLRRERKEKMRRNVLIERKWRNTKESRDKSEGEEMRDYVGEKGKEEREESLKYKRSRERGEEVVWEK